MIEEDERKVNQAGAYTLWTPTRDELLEAEKQKNRARVAREVFYEREATASLIKPRNVNDRAKVKELLDLLKTK